MRNFSALLLTAALFCSAYSSTVTMPSRTGVGFAANGTFHDSAASISCPALPVTTDFFWFYYDACTCMCPYPAIALASKRAFYVSKKAMDYSGYMGNPAKLADTTLFTKCSTATTSYPISTDCPISSAVLVEKLGNYGLVSGGVDSLPTRLLVFRTMNQNTVPVRIDRVVSHVFTCTAMGGIAYAPIYDSMQITYGYELTGIHEGHFTGSMNGAPAPGSSLRIAESQGACFISGLDAGENRLEIFNVRGQTVFSKSVNSSSFAIGKNVLEPGLYILCVHSHIGNDRLVFPVH
jgi:hypothetical protein